MSFFVQSLDSLTLELCIFVLRLIDPFFLRFLDEEQDEKNLPFSKGEEIYPLLFSEKFFISLFPKITFIT